LVRRVHYIMALGAVVGAVSSVVGLYVSYYAEVASGAAIVLTATVLFLLTFLFSPRRGLLAAVRTPVPGG
jgi:manganese/iron transport system permease protein